MTKNYNPELDHEFNEEKTSDKKGIPLIYRDFDGVAEPYEMYAISRLNGVKSKGFKSILLKIVILILAFAVGGALLFGVVPWIISLINPDYQYSFGLFFGN